MVETREQELVRLIRQQREDDRPYQRPQRFGGGGCLPVLSLERVLEHGVAAVLANSDGRQNLGALGERRRDAVLRRTVAASGPCWRCGGTAVEADHLIPASLGGEDVRENLAPACRRCNAEKFDRLEQAAVDLAIQQGYLPELIL